jgi:catechol 2,3-dioxygenase-like lactoylglutathione lyase family enzyme
MFGELDHIGYIVRDVDAAVAAAQEAFDLPIARTSALEQYSILATFLGEGTGTLEIFTFTDPEVLEPRLDGEEGRLDHVAFRVADLTALAATLGAAGVRFCGPDRREDLSEPVSTGPSLALWTRPETSAGIALQLIQPPAR